MQEEQNQGSQHDHSQQMLPDIKYVSKPDPQISPIAAGFIGLIGGFFLYQVVGGLITIIIFGLEVEKAPVNAMRFVTMGGQILFILLPALLFSKMFYRNVSEIVRLKVPKWEETLLFILGIIVLTPLLQNYLYIQNHYVELLASNSSFINSVKELLDSLNKLLEEAYGNLISVNNFYEGILVIIVVALVPAISEEFMFRGFVQKSFEFKLKPFRAALITAAFFGIYHFNPYGIIPLILLGLYFGFAAYMSNSIVIPVVLHFLNNFAAVTLYFILGDEDLIKSAPEGEIDIQSSFMSFLGLLVLFGGVIFLIKRYYSKVKVS
jgi:membrane protease YdiL (CAAX protease family)